ncbi:UNVERIFIED_CONTAM: hypothetical protein HDU68_008559 [Siphonaria sp. JEL0065]|nr:hypothetical protein HDU68_008559 [Siphonaria sp. JEL0065]
MWSNEFPSFWFVWGDDAADNGSSQQLSKSGNSSTQPPNLHILRSKESKTWAEGINFLLKSLEQSLDCEYIFTHDDDLQFRLGNTSVDDMKTSALDQTLVSLLLEHQPAVAGFPWDFGDNKYSGMKSQKEHQADKRVNVLTGFDSGMILYHKSIVNLFIPYSPRGEGGFHGSWSLCAHFITLFAPLTFKGAAIRLNAITYENLVSISNVPIKERKSPGKKPKKEDGLVVHAESRHPYEYAFNKPYVQFLSTGLVNPSLRFGRELLQQDIAWDVERMDEQISIEDLRLGTKSHRTFNRWTVLNQIADFYDLSHPILSNNSWIQSKFTKMELAEYMKMRYQDGLDYGFIVHLFTGLEDMDSFLRQWESLNQATRVTNPVKVQVNVDNRESMDFVEFITRLRKLRVLKCIHGPVSIKVNTKKKGVVQMLMDAWFPNSGKEYAIFIPREEVVLSRNFLEYSQQLAFRYLFSNQQNSHLMGVSLHGTARDASKDTNWTSNTHNNTPFLLQHPPSDGMILSPQQWTEFVTWFNGLSHDFEPMIYDSAVNQWDAGKRWDKFLARFLVEFGKAFVYPNFPLGSSLVGETTQQFLESNFETTSNWDSIFDQKRRLALLTTKLISQPHNPNPFDPTTWSSSPKLPPLSTLPIYNHLFSPIQKQSSLTSYSKKTKLLDKCTLMLYIKDRTRSVYKRIQHYQTHPLIDSIIVIWNSHENSTTLIPIMSLNDVNSSTTVIPVHVAIPRNMSPMNRFLLATEDLEQIRTGCIVSVDEDVDLYAEDLTGVVRAFQKRVGGYTEIIRVVWNGGRSSAGKFGVGVFHVRYLEIVAKRGVGDFGRDVEEVGGCADVVFSAVVRREAEAGDGKRTDGDGSVYYAKRDLGLFVNDNGWMFGEKIDCSRFQ